MANGDPLYHISQEIKNVAGDMRDLRGEMRGLRDDLADTRETVAKMQGRFEGKQETRADRSHFRDRLLEAATFVAILLGSAGTFAAIFH